jgi:uncharacterized protein YjbI with pentapeptide repeats
VAKRPGVCQAPQGPHPGDPDPPGRRGRARVPDLAGLCLRSGWTGLGAYENPNYAEQPRFLWGKSVWDWLDLLLVPVVLAIGGLLFNRAERRAEREIAAERTQEARLQSYLDKMTELMLEKGLRTSEPKSEVRDIARARTLTALRSLDGERKDVLLQFLYESDLVNRKAIIDLNKADLRWALLRGALLLRANLSWAILGEADLHGAILGEADLRGADLSKAILRWTDLLKADLFRADLRWADLRWADLRWADLRKANLTGADLREADLTGAKVTEEQLAQARSLKGATMPDGTVHE